MFGRTLLWLFITSSFNFLYAQDCTESICANFNENDYEFYKSVKALSGKFQTYDFNVDKAIPWKELKVAMNVLDNLRQNYAGKAVRDLIDVQTITDRLMDDYQRATNNMFEWCVAAKEIFNFLYSRKNVFTKLDDVKHFVTETLISGQSTINGTIQELYRIQNELTNLNKKLKLVRVTINEELRIITEEYEVERKKFNEELRKSRAAGKTALDDCLKRKQLAEEAARKSKSLSWLIFGLGAAVTGILTFFAGPAGLALGTLGTGAVLASQRKGAAGASVSCANELYQLSILQNEWPSKSTQQKTLEDFYILLDAALENAIKNVSACKTALGAEITYGTLVLGKTKGVYQIARQYPSNLIHTIFVDLQNLGTVLGNYVKRHSGGPVVPYYDQNNRRRRRQSLSPLARIELEFINIKAAVKVYLNSTEKERTERFWDINYYDQSRLSQSITFVSHSA